MNNATLFTVWGGLYALCAALSFLPDREGLASLLCFLSGIAFFVPPFVLLYRTPGKRMPRLFAGLSLASLLLTTVLIIANFFTVGLSQAMGTFFHVLLCMISVPMFCLNYWVLSLFIWAVLLVCSLGRLKNK